MRKQAYLSYLDPNQQEQVYNLIREFWSVFDERGVFVPVKNYECVIDTGTAQLVAVKKILYGKQETVIMQCCILALAKVGHIRQIADGSWLFKPLLAPKPHQENVSNNDGFVWHFCVNYIPLMGVTCVIAYPIPRYDLAVFNKFGQGGWMWMFDAPMGYHQLAVALASQAKLAFQGVDVIKWKYTVMPFGPTNGPVTFINFIHDINSIWKELAKKHGLTIDNDTNTCIIVDDIVSWYGSFKLSLAFMQCQLIVCRAYNLSLKLGKSHFFPRCFEFVGIDMCSDGNCPVKSKHQLLETWPAPERVRNVAKFLGFVQFYSQFVPNFEIRVAALCGVIKQEYTDAIGPHWPPEAQAAWEDLKGAILSDLCIWRFDHCKLIMLHTDFSSLGFGFVLLQPGNNEVLPWITWMEKDSPS